MWPIIAGVAAGVSALTGMYKAFSGSSDEEARGRRKQEYLAAITRARTSATDRHAKLLAEGVSNIRAQTIASQASARQAAKQRALAMGRGGDAEAFIIPAEGQVTNAGAEAITGFQRSSNEAAANEQSQLDQAELGAEQGWADRPIEPKWYEYLGETAGAVSGFAGGMSKVQAENDYTQALQDDLPKRRSTNQLNAYNQLWQNSTNRRSRLGY